jgi:2-dehydropantoate 2-reductase
VDVVLFCVKLQDSESAASSLLPVMRPGSAVISLQNGVQKDDTLRAIFGEGAVMGGVAYMATTIARPGVIAQTGAIQRMIFGEYNAASSARAEALLEACKRGGIDAELSPDIRRAIWEKYVFLVGLSGATTAMRMPLGPIRENPVSRQFLLDLMREVVAVGRAHGVALPEDYAEQRLAFADGLPPDMTSSMRHDLDRGRPLEVRWLSGGVVTLGAAVGVPTPANRAVHDILVLYAAGRPAS